MSSASGCILVTTTCFVRRRHGMGKDKQMGLDASLLVQSPYRYDPLTLNLHFRWSSQGAVNCSAPGFPFRFQEDKNVAMEASGRHYHSHFIRVCSCNEHAWDHKF